MRFYKYLIESQTIYLIPIHWTYILNMDSGYEVFIVIVEEQKYFRHSSIAGAKVLVNLKEDN